MGATCCKEQDEIDFNQGPELAHFQLLKIIGQGVFGKVRIIQHKRTKKQYALKYIDKSICIRQKAISNVILERNILEHIEYPFIANLRYAFQDDETLFMALDLMLGGDLRFHLNQQLTCHELQVRHHVACIALSLNYLHKRRIAHRDIKPENILLDQKGYAHLSDFNIAIQFDPGQPLLWSMAGTMAYMAPEMLARKGYSTHVDWWSLGVVTFELLFGKRPFTAPSKESLIHAILHDPFILPQNAHELVSKECIDVITGLLDKSPFHRLGCSSDGFEEFKSHPWFRGLDWDLLEHKQLTPPIRPDKKNSKLRMMSYTEFQEDGLKSHKRTSAIRTSYDNDSSPVTMEARYRMKLEDEFLNYDFTQHQMAEQEGGHFSSFLEQRRNSLKRQYDRFKRRSQSSYHDFTITPATSAASIDTN
ncbi:kinase-like domain-containing protein [Blakeslea trispora]|nr:kinase-like domain-containing protein [Blakeslea trispora]